MVELGTSTSDVDLAMSSIYAHNRELVDDASDRRFLVRDGRELPLAGSPPEEANPPVHPDHEDRGTRSIPVEDAVLLEEGDLPGREERIWLKGLGSFLYTRDVLQYTGEEIDVVREGGVDVVHWVPATGSVPVRLRTTEEDVLGRAEPGVADLEPDELIQFERVGFARIDGRESVDDGERIVAYYAHP